MKEDTKVNRLEFDEVIRYYARFFRAIGVMPVCEDGATLTGRVAHLLLFACMILSSAIHWSMFVVYLLKKDVPDIDSICEAVIVSGVHVRFYILLSRRRAYTRLVDDCGEIWRDMRASEYPLILGFEAKIRRLFNCTCVTVFMIDVFYCCTALLINYQREASAGNESSRRLLPFKWYVEDAEAHWPGYEAVFALQFTVCTFMTPITAGVDVATPLLMMLNSGYLRVLQERFYAESSHRDDDAAKRGYAEFVACAKLHQRILEVCARIERLTRILFLVQLLCNGYNTSLIMIRVVNAQQGRYRYLPVLSLSLGQLFICQYAPDYLVDESKAVALAAYSASASWMRYRFGKLFAIVIARAQRPVQMTAGGIVNLSLECFGSMLTSVISFFTVLRNFSAN